MRNSLRRIDFLLAPPLCLSCGERLAPLPGGAAGLCPQCGESLPRFPPQNRCRLCGGLNDTALEVCHECATMPRPWLCGVTAFPYHGKAGDLIRAYKYNRATAFAPFFAKAIADQWRAEPRLFQPECVVPVPLYWLRRLSRGFNQAQLVAQCLARELGIPCRQPLRRQRATGHQARLDAQARFRNLRRAFVVPRNQRRNILGRNILLLDDVFTTGATLAAAAEVLLDAGAREIAVATIARA